MNRRFFKRFFRRFWRCLYRNTITLMFVTLIITTMLLMFGKIYNSNPEVKPKIYSLVEGQINGEETYFLLLTDPTGIGNALKTSPKMVIDSSYAFDSTKRPEENCDVSLNGLEITYPKKYKDLDPLINTIKKEAGYEISGVIGRDTVLLDSLNRTLKK